MGAGGAWSAKLMNLLIVLRHNEVLLEVAFRGFIITFYLKALTPFAQCLTLRGVAPGGQIEGPLSNPTCRRPLAVLDERHLA